MKALGVDKLEQFVSMRGSTTCDMDVVIVYFVHYMETVYSTRLNKYEEIEENIKIYITCIEQDSNLVPPCKQSPNLTIVLTYHK